MTGTLLKVSRSKDGKSLVAEIGIAGEFDVDAGPSAFNARIDFEFVPQGVPRFPRLGQKEPPRFSRQPGGSGRPCCHTRLPSVCRTATGA